MAPLVAGAPDFHESHLGLPLMAGWLAGWICPLCCRTQAGAPGCHGSRPWMQPPGTARALLFSGIFGRRTRPSQLCGRQCKPGCTRQRKEHGWYTCEVLLGVAGSSNGSPLTFFVLKLCGGGDSQLSGANVSPFP
eukprot:1154291-Pelagomonas_calceolata.AAC.11